MSNQKELPELTAKCSDTIKLLNNYIEEPSQKNESKAWKGLRELIYFLSDEKDEYAELIEIRNNLAVLRQMRNTHRLAGREDSFYKVERDILRNYRELTLIVKEIQKSI